MKALLLRIEEEFPGEYKKISQKKESMKGYNPNRYLDLARVVVPVAKVDLLLEVQVLKLDLREYLADERASIIKKLGDTLLNQLGKPDLYLLYCGLFEIPIDQSRFKIVPKRRSKKSGSIKNALMKKEAKGMEWMAGMPVKGEASDLFQASADGGDIFGGFGNETYSDGDLSDGNEEEFGFGSM